MAYEKMNDKGLSNAHFSGNLYDNASSSHETNGLSAQKTSKIIPQAFRIFGFFFRNATPSQTNRQASKKNGMP